MGQSPEPTPQVGHVAPLVADTLAALPLSTQADIDQFVHASVQEALISLQPALPEAPASVNVRVTIGGREVQWTLRDSDEGRLAARLAALLARYPQPQPAQPVRVAVKSQATVQPAASQGPGSPQQHNAAAQHQRVSGFCKVHNMQMHLNTGKDGRTWYSHRLPEGGFCKGKGR